MLKWLFSTSDDSGMKLLPLSADDFIHVLRAAASERKSRGVPPWSCIVLNACHSADLAGGYCLSAAAG